MLAIPTPFPNQGSYALIDIDGETRAARIISRHDDGAATIALLDRAGASGNRTVAFDALLDPTELTEAERAEMARLSPATGRKAQARYKALRLRDIHFTVLDAQMAVLNGRVAA